jgi:hypothetical protein
MYPEKSDSGFVETAHELDKKGFYLLVSWNFRM